MNGSSNCLQDVQILDSYACGTCPLALLWLPQSVNCWDIEAFIFLFGKTKQTRISSEITLEGINYCFRACCNNKLYIGS